MKRRLTDYSNMILNYNIVMKEGYIYEDGVDDANTLRVYRLEIPKLEKEKYTKIQIPFSYTSPVEVNLSVYQIENIDITNNIDVKNQYNNHRINSKIYELTLECANYYNEEEFNIKHNIIDLSKLNFQEEDNMLVATFIIENNYDKSNTIIDGGYNYPFHIESFEFTYEHYYQLDYSQEEPYKTYEQIINDPLIEYMYICIFDDETGIETSRVYNTSYFELTYVGGNKW